LREPVRSRCRSWLPYLPDVNAYARAWDRIRAQAVRKVTPALYATVNLNGVRADDELDQYLHHVERLAVVGAHYVDAGTQHLVLRIGSLTAHPESLAEQLLPALEETGSS
jgi:hypothetical protein